MKKLKLEVGGLAVESFPTSQLPEEMRGTVEGAALNPSVYPYCTHGTYPCKTALSLCPCTDTL
jgi:hypothetical protein